MARDIALLVNPAAGGGRGLRLVEPVVHRLRAGGARVRVLHGRDAAEADRLARDAVAARPDALVTLGGDGLAHLAVQAVAGTDVPLGVVPAGTGNDVARMLGIPRRDPLAAADVVLGGAVRVIDAARCAGGWFVSVVGAGFDTLVNERANRMARPRGQARYLLALAAELRALRPIPYMLELDGTQWQTEAVLVAVGNGPSYGGGMRICPDARLDDGLLDVTVIGPIGRAELAVVFPSVYAGRHVMHPAVSVRRARVVSLAAPDVTAYADGEPAARLPVTCEAVPGALRVLAPAQP